MTNHTINSEHSLYSKNLRLYCRIVSVLDFPVLGFKQPSRNPSYRTYSYTQRYTNQLTYAFGACTLRHNIDTLDRDWK